MRSDIPTCQRKPACWLLAFLMVAFAGGAAVAEESEDNISLNLRDADIRILIETVSDITGKQFLVDPRVTGNVTVFSGGPMSKDSLYATFLSVLQVHGFAAVHSGSSIKVVPDQSARQAGGPVETRPPQTSATDRFVTKVIRLREVEAEKAVAVLRPLVPQNGHLAAHRDSNTLVVSDREANIARLEQIIARIDQAGGQGIEVIRLEHANATDLVNVVAKLAGAAAKGAAGTQTRLSADERSNSVLLSGGPGERLKMRSLIAHLDIPLENTGDTHVIFLKYAKAQDLATLLQRRYQKKDPKGTPGNGSVDIQAHEFNNALLISAPPQEFRSIQGVVRQLDIRRAQVLVEAVIAEVSSDLTSELGVQMAGGDVSGNGTTPLFLTNFGSTAISGLLQSAAAGTPIALPSGAWAGVGEIGGTGTQWAVLLSALAGDASTNILSTPVILATDNEDAEIVVGQNVPFVTGQYTSTGTAGTTTSVTNPFQTIEREDVGITLKIKPQINEGSSIRLEIDQEVSSLASTSLSASDIVTNKRAIKTTITVEDGQIVVLGGLIEDRIQDTTQKVPVLGDVPLLGQLFRYDRNSQIKQNLMVFLRPVILLDPERVSQYSSQKYGYLRFRQMQAAQPPQETRQKGPVELPADLQELFKGPSPSAPQAPPPAAEAQPYLPFELDM